MGETHWVEAGPGRIRCGLECGTCGGAGVRRQHPAYGDGLAAADLETAAERVHPRLLASSLTRVERIIGRKVSPAWAANATTTGIAKVTPKDAFAALMEGRTILDLSEGLQLRRVRVMGVNRIELSGFTDTMRQRLTAYGLFHEIISWKLRMFVPVDASGPAVLAKLFDRWPVERIGEREAA